MDVLGNFGTSLYKAFLWLNWVRKGYSTCSQLKILIYSYLYARFWYKLFHESLLDYIFIACLPICRRDTAIRLCSYLTRNGKKFWHLPALYICKRIRNASIICFPLLRFFRLLHREDISSQLCNL